MTICTLLAPILLALFGPPTLAPMPAPLTMPATTPGQPSEYNQHPVFTTPIGHLR